MGAVGATDAVQVQSVSLEHDGLRHMPLWQTLVPEQSSSLEQLPLQATNVPGGLVGLGVAVIALVGPVVGVVPGTLVGVGVAASVGVGDAPGVFVGVGVGVAPGHKQSTSLVHAGFRQTPTVCPCTTRHDIPVSQSRLSSHQPSQLLFATSNAAVQTSCGAGVAVGFSTALGML